MNQSTVAKLAFGVLFAIIGVFIITVALTDSAEGTVQDQCEVLYIKTDHHGTPYVQDGEHVTRWSEDVGEWVQHEVHREYRWTRTDTWRGKCEEETTTTTTPEETTTTTVETTTTTVPVPTTVPETTTTTIDTTTTTVDVCETETVDPECADHEQTPPTTPPVAPTTIPAPVAERATLPDTGWSAGWLFGIAAVALSGGGIATTWAKKRGM